MMNDANNLAAYYFHQGTNFHTYEYLGCNLKSFEGGIFVYTFRTWAPHADSVSVVSDFHGWDSPIPMKKITESGIWECEYSSSCDLEKKIYKFRIENGGRVFLKGDPYARFSRGGADGASIIFTKKAFAWTDKMWLNKRKKTVRGTEKTYLPMPLNIYEVHFGSMMRHEDNSYYSYREMAEVLPQYLKHMGYTHVEFLPLAEHPFDGSWGYQVCGFYAPTSRFGDPDDFKYLVNQLHKNGIGVIMDWVPAHFPKDEWGLYEFDGQPLYEYLGVDRQESETWGTRFFDLGREEIQSFLISNALYFFREFHIDGLRVDAVASMLYLDYDRSPGSWVPNHNGGRENLEAIAFFQKLNTIVFSEFPDILMIAEESGDYGSITKPVFEGGLGFNMKWNMGFANDFYDYISTDPFFRKYKHKALNFPIMYAFSENYLLPISHDEVVHGKLSFINKMNGEYEDKFRQARASLMLFMTYPGKKMLFMGTEYGQFREWDYENSLEWFMLDYPKHAQFRQYVSALNHFYLSHRQLWELDFDFSGFEWILPNEADRNLVAYKRRGLSSDSLIVVINFSGETQNVKLSVGKAKRLERIFETEPAGFAEKNTPVYDLSGQYFSDIVIPSFSGAIFIERKEKIKIKV